MNKIKTYAIIIIFSLLLTLSISGCKSKPSDLPNITKTNSTTANNTFTTHKNTTNTTSTGMKNKTNINEISANSPENSSDQKFPCITSYPLLIQHESGKYIYNELKIYRTKIRFSASDYLFSIDFAPRLDTTNPEEEIYTSINNYRRVVPNDITSCLYPTRASPEYSIAICNITKFNGDTYIRNAYQAQILIYNHSVDGCKTNQSKERIIWFTGCNNSQVCYLPAFSTNTIGLIATQSAKDEIQNITLRINDGEPLPQMSKVNPENYSTYYSFGIVTDSLSQRIYKAEITIFLKNGFEEKYERLVKITSPLPPSDYEMNPDCFTDFTLEQGDSIAVQGLGEITLEKIYTMPQMVLISVKHSSLPRIWGYGTNNPEPLSYRVKTVDLSEKTITVEKYDPSCEN
jgi:hypothetical protein